ncbi:hypothetical protein VP1G_02038 [Cytospora mali]|uniref:Swi5-dependent recombination DNA repair protein 1 n=1 Tax=Cytospora mali TaxID=578113 RepID=A0A194USS7_CYTMA|nr:hypothetical protein VP1G_02038 [Valsa mali var. pyri (nom. inval.)]
MSTPAAKRRRVDAANAVLRKPFQSPVIRRPDAADGTPGPGDTPTSSKTPGTAGAGKRSLGNVYSPSSPSVPRKLGGVWQQTRPASPLLKLSKTSELARVGKDRRVSGGVHLGSIGPEGVHDDHDDGNPFMALVNAHRTTGQDTMVKEVDKQLEIVQQAKKIEDASEGKYPGGPVDQELRDLVVKWKGASRLAAEELFEMVKCRVDNSGGPKAWKAMQRRQMEFYRGFGHESPTKSKAVGNDDDDDNDDEGKEYAQGEVESSLEKGQRLQEGGRGRGSSEEEEEEDEPEFNMALMLRSLNIDLSLLGYDEAEEKWND